jgi:Fe-coproporphyrin III synthase
MNFRAFMNTISTRAYSLPIVILYVTEGCNLRCISCSYRERLPGELSMDDIAELSQSLVSFGLKTIVYSGGEPLMRRDFPGICALFKGESVSQSLLTNGLLLEKRFREIQEYVSEIIISIDGPDAPTHDRIRGLASFAQIIKGIEHIMGFSDRPSIAIRTVVQKSNYNRLQEIVRFARNAGVDRISFLAADVLSDSFGRAAVGPVVPKEELQLTAEETVEFRESIDRMIRECADEFSSGFISDSPGRMQHIVQYFEALAGRSPFPRNSCNAPMVSAVITSTGDVQPCYFLPACGNLRQDPVHVLANNDAIRTTRSAVRRYSLDRCRTCVCTLHKGPLTALRDGF